MKNLKKNKVFLGLIIFSVVVIVSALANSPKYKADVNFDYNVFGKLVSDKSKQQSRADTTSTLYAKGNDIEITNEEFNFEVNVFQLKDSQNPEADALQYLLEIKVLYYNAVKNGYSVSESEVDEVIAGLKNDVKLAENSNDIQEFLKGFGSEDAYWEYIRDITKKDIITSKYLEDLKIDYATKNNLSAGSTEFYNYWGDYKQSLVSQFIDEQDVQYFDASK